MIDYSLLQLVRDRRIVAVETRSSKTRLVILAPQLVGLLGGGQNLWVDASLDRPLTMAPWIGGHPLPLTEAVKAFDIYLLDVLTARDEPETLELAALPNDDTATPINGGAVVVSGGIVEMTTDAGASISENSLRQAASAGVATQLREGSMPEMKRRLSAVISASARPELEGAGFRRRGGRYYRVREQVAQSVTLVHGRWNTILGLAFSFELGVFVGDFGSGRPNPATLFVSGGPAIVRPMASLWNRPGQQYFLRTDTSSDDLARRLTHDFKALALPWLNALSTVDGIVAFLDREAKAGQGNSSALHAALLLAKVGRQDEARRFLAETKEPRDFVAHAARNYGITFD